MAQKLIWPYTGKEMVVRLSQSVVHANERSTYCPSAVLDALSRPWSDEYFTSYQSLVFPLPWTQQTVIFLVGVCRGPGCKLSWTKKISTSYSCWVQNSPLGYFWLPTSLLSRCRLTRKRKETWVPEWSLAYCGSLLNMKIICSNKIYFVYWNNTKTYALEPQQKHSNFWILTV